MHITVIAVGRMKEKYLLAGAAEYLKRVKPYASVEIIEVPDEKAPENLSVKEEEIVRQKEAERILKALKPEQVVAAMAIGGKLISSEELAGQLANWGLAGKSDVAFVIGGSLGLHESVLKRADVQLSFGRITFPHQLMRLVLLEQVYRAFKINRGEPYHK